MWWLAVIGLISAHPSAPSLPKLPYNWLSLATLTPTEAFPSRELDWSSHSSKLCSRLIGLNPIQKDVCAENPLVIQYVARGIREALYHCQDQFKNERWNCSDRYEVTDTPYGTFRDVLGKTLRSATREGAFLTAVSTAGVVYEVTKGCSTGNLSECGCDTKPDTQRYTDTIDMQQEPRPPSSHHRLGQRSVEHFSWGGCSDNVPYGKKFARRFLDDWETKEFEKDGDAKHLVHKHNFFVGREQIAQNIRRTCRCHGVSGSCEFKTCWLTMPKFSEVAEMLKKRYDNFAVQVEPTPASSTTTPTPPPLPLPSPSTPITSSDTTSTSITPSLDTHTEPVAKKVKKRLRRKERGQRQMEIRGNELTYLLRSPSYCERNDTLGILGTSGRECVHRSHNPDDCDLLCCGRGYNTRMERRTTQCHCKFVWCCQVKCKECIHDVTVHTCK